MSDFLFAADDSADTPPTQPDLGVWKVLIVDDEHEVHSVTRLALSGFKFEGRSLEIISAYSGEEAKPLFAEHTFAVALVDVVMETDTAGLDLIRYIREQINNHDIRLVLRTGQPGQAPEHKVISDYDINDYKAKTELTSQKLFTLMHSSLRSFRDIETLQRSRVGMSHIIRSAQNIFELKGFIEFVQSTLEQLTCLINVSHSVVMSTESGAFEIDDSHLHPLCGVGKFEQLKVDQELDEWPLLKEALVSKASIYLDNELVVFCRNMEHTILFYVTGFAHLDEVDKNLVNLFADNIMVALENIRIHEQTTHGLQTMVARLAEVIEKRTPTSGDHVLAVGKLCKEMAKLSGENSQFCELIEVAALLHDVGKIALPEELLLKTEGLSEAEWSKVKQYPAIGAKVLDHGQSELMKMAAEIALNLHERHNGTGYPNGLKGVEIPISAQICSLCNAFDAMQNDVSYRPGMNLKDTLAHIKSEAGASFDPDLVTLLLDNAELFDQVRQTAHQAAGA